MWDPMLVLDVAIGVDDLESQILPRYGLDMDDYAVLSTHPVFRRELAVITREVHENGLPFRRKAQFQAESYLEILDQLVNSDITPASVRLEAINKTVLWAGLVPKEDKTADGGEKNNINIQINF